MTGSLVTGSARTRTARACREAGMARVPADVSIVRRDARDRMDARS
ncbi:hypothetical protein [Nonomuraea sp. NPDC050643]